MGYKSLTEQYLDSTGLFKEAIISILATLAKQERVRLSERTKAGMARKVAQGVKMGAPAEGGGDEQLCHWEGDGHIG